MRVPYYPEESQPYIHKYYSDQVGDGVGVVFEGSTIQRGSGVGNLLSGIFKSTLPLLKTGAKTIGKELLRTGASVAKDALQGRNFAESASENFKEAGSNLLDNLAQSLSNPPRRPKRKSSNKSKKKTKRRKTQDLFKNIRVV